MDFILNITGYIWNIVVFCIVFGISYAINVFYLFNGIVPLLWIPYVTCKIIKKDFKPNAILHCLIAPIIWNILLIVLFALAYKFTFLGKLVNMLFFSLAGIVGGILALFHTVVNLFSKQAREEFLNGISKNKKQQDAYNEYIGKLMGYTYSFVYSNTQGLKYYGTKNGYIPNNYINDFKKVFAKTIQNVEIIKNEYLEKLPEEEKEIILKEWENLKEYLVQEDKEIWEDSYIRNTKKEKSRKEFLMDVEACKDTIIQNHVQTFRRKYPSIFID